VEINPAETEVSDVVEEKLSGGAADLLSALAGML
jgi:hypothetical protein